MYFQVVHAILQDARQQMELLCGGDFDKLTVDSVQPWLSQQTSIMKVIADIKDKKHKVECFGGSAAVLDRLKTRPPEEHVTLLVRKESPRWAVDDVGDFVG